MTIGTSKLRKTPLALAIAAAIGLAASTNAQAWVSPEPHIFSVDDIQGGFDGSTYGAAGVVQDPTIICGITSTCPPDAAQPVVDKQGVVLYPVEALPDFEVPLSMAIDPEGWLVFFGVSYGL